MNGDPSFLHTKVRFKERFKYDLSEEMYYQLGKDCEAGFQTIGGQKVATQSVKHIKLSRLTDRHHTGNQIHKVILKGIDRKVYVVYNPKRFQVVTVLDPEDMARRSVAARNIIYSE